MHTTKIKIKNNDKKCLQCVVLFSDTVQRQARTNSMRTNSVLSGVAGKSWCKVYEENIYC